MLAQTAPVRSKCTDELRCLTHFAACNAARALVEEPNQNRNPTVHDTSKARTERRSVHAESQFRSGDVLVYAPNNASARSKGLLLTKQFFVADEAAVVRPHQPASSQLYLERIPWLWMRDLCNLLELAAFCTGIESKKTNGNGLQTIGRLTIR